MNRFSVPLFLASVLLLTGCDISNVGSSSGLPASTLGPLQGRVHGGQQPVADAHVYLYAVGTSGNGGKDIAASASNASVSLLASFGGNVRSDGTNYYVNTDTGGNFSITGDYSCTPGTQLYLYVIGGDPGAGTNSRAAFLSGLGECPFGSSTLDPHAFFLVNEVSTVATAYALAGFATDALHISAATSVSGDPAAELLATGVANAMANINNLVNISSGTAMSTTPAGNGNVPQSEINTLANILAACVNSSDTLPANCTKLFNAALSDGTSGSTPADVATAAINIAHNAGQNVGTRYSLQPGLAAPFMPSLGGQPNDFGISISFAGGGASNPQSVSIDSTGNVWGISAGNLVNWYSPLGAPLAANGLPSSTTDKLNSLVLDTNGNAWALDVSGNYTEFSPSGATLSPSGGISGGNSGSSALTSDSFGYLWSADNTDGSLSRFDPANSLQVSQYTVDSGSLLAADSAGFVWLAANGGTLYKVNQAGVTVSTFPSFYTTASAIAVDSTNNVYVDEPTTQLIKKVGADGTKTSFVDSVGGAQTLAVDGRNNIWSGNNMIAEHTSTGTNISGAGFLLPAGTVTKSIAIDSSGDLWAAAATENNGQPGTHYLEYIGLAAPATTPLSYATTHGTIMNAQNLTVGFNGPDVQFPYMDRIYAATNSYYQSIGKSYPAGGRYCHAYLSWDIAQQAVGSGPLGTEGSRAWFEDWLAHAQGHCDRALVTFKYIDGITQAAGYPTPANYETAMVAFLGISWTYTGWTGAIDYTAWNEPQNGAGSGDGLTIQIPAQTAADYYLALRKHCLPGSCTVAAGDFGSNGNQWQNYVQNCTNDSAALCGSASYMDKYKHWIVTDAPSYGFASTFRPEVFAYHGWDDVNNYINSGSHCTDPQRCTIRALLTSLTDGAWSNSVIWDTEVAAGQNPQSNPDPITQACAASYLFNLTASVSSRFTRIYYTQPYTAGGNYFSLFDITGNSKPAFTVVANHSISYTPPSGSTCP